jgi:two-component system, NtrC family, nitrogen regulation sensor histidine kinase NtrY
MVFKQFEGRLIVRVLLLLVSLSLPALVIGQGWPEALVFVVPLLVFQVGELLRFLRQAQEELNHFLEAVKYRDFSRFFNEQEETAELKELREGFNQITTTFKAISQEKETQYQNLRMIMALVDTGILSYNLQTGEVLLMNESLKRLLHLPALKTVQSLAKRDPALAEAVQALPPGHSRIATVRSNVLERDDVRVLLSATGFQNEGLSYKLVAFQNVNEALDENESQAWQKLLNVMTHEIMNSVAPISSLAETLKHRLQEMAVTGAFPAEREDLEEGISTIKRRSEGLLRFAQTYRNLNKITTLNLATLSVRELFGNLQRLMQPTLAQKNITLEIKVKDPGLSLQADPGLLDQVLINLLVNAMEAVKDVPEPRIILSAYLAADRKKVIRVADNGSGMSREVQEKIFIPFFSTKKQGSGIGLSLCKQIVLLHKGTIQVQSEEGKGTAFVLRFG